ncbi:MAG: efflux RND transporter periplasmic adaptor subunit [Deltaproteobacteria bacterium]|nr:efflux RND transporter periplasmic adaptor subunit [Deltaproteobacteria bacterium]
MNCLISLCIKNVSKRPAKSCPPAITLRKAIYHGFLLVAVLLAASGCETPASPQKAATPPPPPEVLVTEVVQQDVPIYFEWIGTTEGFVNAQIRPRVQGNLQSRDYKEGSFVKAGQLIFVIDPREYQAALKQAIGDLRRAEANLGKTQLDVARYTPLAKEGAISQQELDNAIQAHQANKASVEAARATVERAELNLSWTKVTAPISGIAGISVAQIGDLVTPNTVLTTISQVDPIKVYYPISEQEYLHFASRIRAIEQGRGDAAPPLELTLADGRVYPKRGTFSLADRQVDLRTGTITVQSVFPNPDNILRPGQYAKIRVAAETRKGALLIPQQAVQHLQGSHQVAVVGADNKVELRSVKVGDQVGNMWIVTEGIKQGERIVVSGIQKVKMGGIVNPKPFVTPSEPAQATAGAPKGT